MTTHKVQPLSIGREMKLPLAGHYPILTWQLNATLHQSTGLCKFVSVLREPVDKAEIVRDFGELEPWMKQQPIVLRYCETMLRAMDELGGSGRGTVFPLST